jgi:hypothetical protein
MPDISMSAALDGGVLAYVGIFSDPLGNGWYIFGGTSESAPEFAGIVAMADQVAGIGAGGSAEGKPQAGSIAAMNAASKTQFRHAGLITRRLLSEAAPSSTEHQA